MNTFLTDHDFSKSAANLDQKRLGSQIYEGIHMLSSLLGINDQLVNPKRSVINHPATQLWVGYEAQLLRYIADHIDEWECRGYKCPTNIKNYDIIYDYLYYRQGSIKYVDFYGDVPWITDAVIQCHRSVLIQKKPEHYGAMWPEGRRDLVMFYGWR